MTGTARHCAEDDSLTGGDPCPACGITLDWDETGNDRTPEVVHPDPQCGWVPDGYPSTRRGWEHGRHPDDGTETAR